jgi:peptidoglycan/LPS O-acetylase OafA/YrhL
MLCLTACFSRNVNIYKANVYDKHSDPFGNIPSLFYFVALSCFVIRSLSVALNHAQQLNYSATHTRIDSLFFGVLIAYYWNYKHRVFSMLLPQHKNRLILLGVLLLSPSFFFRLETNDWVPPLLFITNYVGSGLLLIGFMHVTIPSNRISRFIGHLGACSYSIYLWHMPMHDWLTPQIGILLHSGYSPSQFWISYAFVYLVGSLVLGVVMNRLVEFPILRLRNAMFRSNAHVL